MNVYYEEEGSFRVGSILADNDSSLQVEAPHGKRSKIKSSNVLFRFDDALAGFLEQAQRAAEDIDLDFLWECCGADEFSYETLARDYFGHAPSRREAAALLIRLHGAPMYFYKKGKGRYRPAPADSLKAALASVERKRLQAVQQAEYVEQLRRFELPESFRPRLAELLYKPDRNTVEVKAMEEAATEFRLSTLRLLEKCGAIPSTHEYHVNRFLFEHFPRGTGFISDGAAPPLMDLPTAKAQAFSIDDITTTEIDDAFSVTPVPGGWEIGIHIAVPAAGVLCGTPLDDEAVGRLSTVYLPGAKITMLPDAVIEAYSLAEGRICPSLSLYLQVASDLSIRGTRTELEQLHIAANLRHDSLEKWFNEETLSAELAPMPFAAELKVLWELATVLESGRGRPEPLRAVQMDYNFYVGDDERVRIVERKRGAPADKLVAELMILVNSEWGRNLAEAGVPAIYRAQGNGKVRLSTIPSAHQGLGVAQYMWASSPLRRYVDLVNQRQLIAWHRNEPAPYTAGGEPILTAMRDFEAAYETYADFQRGMERYWCLRWLQQEAIDTIDAEVLRDNLLKIDGIPLIARVPSVPLLESGAKVSLRISDIDLLEVTFHAEYCGPA